MTVMTLMTMICRGFPDGGSGYLFHRRWISSIVQSLQSGTCSTGIGVITAVTSVTTFGGGAGPIVVGIDVCLLLWLWREARGVALYLGDGGDSGDEDHDLLGDFTAADRGPQLEDARFHRQSVRTDRERCPVGTQGRL